MRKQVVSAILALLIIASLTQCKKSGVEIIALTGATPTLYGHPVPPSFSFTVDGLVKKKYSFSSDALNALPFTFIRTREFSPEKKFLGSYAYIGISLYNILDGVAPERPKNAPFDRPIDMVVTMTSSSGKSVRFSYGELTMADDAFPVILAFDRREVKPTKDPDKNNKNLFKENLKGFRLVCPGDQDTARYMDDVEKITLGELAISLDTVPKSVRNLSCGSTSITCVSAGKSSPGSFAGVQRMKISDWVRVGHGRGFKGISSAEGFSLSSFLEKNFPGWGPDDFFLFVGCDGYRSLFSGREIFTGERGGAMMILDRIDGKAPEGNLVLGPVKDYFVDRDIRGLSHVVRFKAQ